MAVPKVCINNIIKGLSRATKGIKDTTKGLCSNFVLFGLGGVLLFLLHLGFFGTVVQHKEGLAYQQKCNISWCMVQSGSSSAYVSRSLHVDIVNIYICMIVHVFSYMYTCPKKIDNNICQSNNIYLYVNVHINDM